MTIAFLTHFDEAYRAQGQCMMRSLMQHASEKIRIGVLWLGDKPAISEDHNISVLLLEDFIQGDEQLRDSRNNRSWRSFCWTLEPAVVHYALTAAPDGQIVVYCDADMWWTADPMPVILSAMDHADIALSPHYFPEGRDKPSVGYFNFGIGIFRACDLTRRIVGEWLDQTLAHCDESINDQMYLDAWPDKLGDRLVELPPNINRGPWSLSEIVGDPPFLCGDIQALPLISYHGHEMRRGIGRNPVKIKGVDWNMTDYPIADSTRKAVYDPYIKALEAFL